jgi:hypothetical protein
MTSCFFWTKSCLHAPSTKPVARFDLDQSADGEYVVEVMSRAFLKGTVFLNVRNNGPQLILPVLSDEVSLGNGIVRETI